MCAHWFNKCLLNTCRVVDTIYSRHMKVFHSWGSMFSWGEPLCRFRDTKKSRHVSWRRVLGLAFQPPRTSCTESRCLCSPWGGQAAPEHLGLSSLPVHGMPAEVDKQPSLQLSEALFWVKVSKHWLNANNLQRFILEPVTSVGPLGGRLMWVGKVSTGALGSQQAGRKHWGPGREAMERLQSRQYLSVEKNPGSGTTIGSWVSSTSFLALKVEIISSLLLTWRNEWVEDD